MDSGSKDGTDVTPEQFISMLNDAVTDKQKAVDDAQAKVDRLNQAGQNDNYKLTSFASAAGPQTSGPSYLTDAQQKMTQAQAATASALTAKNTADDLKTQADDKVEEARQAASDRKAEMESAKEVYDSSSARSRQAEEALEEAQQKVTEAQEADELAARIRPNNSRLMIVLSQRQTRKQGRFRLRTKKSWRHSRQSTRQPLIWKKAQRSLS